MRASLAILAGALAGALVLPAAPAMASQDAPVVGDCYSYGASRTGQITAATPSVPCTGPHAAETFFVGSLPDGFGLPSKARPAARLAVTRPCTVRAMNAYLGIADRTLPSRFTAYLVFPTDAQWKAGARWVRCDVVLQGGTALVKFPKPAPEFVASTDPSQFDFCTVGKPRAAKTSAYPCGSPKKNWILVVTQDLGSPGKKFPGTNAVVKQTLKICAKAGNQFSGGSKYPNWWAIWPLARGWNEGRREAMCFVPYRQYAAGLAASSG